MLISLNLRPNAKMSSKRKDTPKDFKQRVPKTEESPTNKADSFPVMRWLSPSEIESLRQDSRDAIRELRKMHKARDAKKSN